MDYSFTVSARDDLVDIWLYSEVMWGEKQADRYVDTLYECCARIIAGIGHTRPVPGMDGVRSYHCGHH